MNRAALLNAAFLQVLWFATVMGAASGVLWPALAWFGVFFAMHMIRAELARQDLAIVLVAATCGLIVDTAWVQLGWVTYAHALPIPGIAPYWIVMLWMGLALTVNYSMLWLQIRPYAASALSLASGPLSYYAASRLGAVTIHEPGLFYLFLGLGWAILVPSLLLFARQIGKPRILGQPL